MSRQNRVRLVAWMGGLVAAGMIAGPATHAQQQSFVYTAPVTVAQPNTLGIGVGDILTATTVYDPGALTGSGQEDAIVYGAGELTFTIGSFLFAGTDDSPNVLFSVTDDPFVRFQDGNFQGIFGYTNPVNVPPIGISLATSSGFQLDRPVDSTTEVFATGGPFSLAQASVN